MSIQVKSNHLKLRHLKQVVFSQVVLAQERKLVDLNSPNRKYRFVIIATFADFARTEKAISKIVPSEGKKV